MVISLLLDMSGYLSNAILGLNCIAMFTLLFGLYGGVFHRVPFLRTMQIYALPYHSRCGVVSAVYVNLSHRLPIKDRVQITTHGNNS